MHLAAWLAGQLHFPDYCKVKCSFPCPLASCSSSSMKYVSPISLPMEFILFILIHWRSPSGLEVGPLSVSVSRPNWPIYSHTYTSSRFLLLSSKLWLPNIYIPQFVHFFLSHGFLWSKESFCIQAKKMCTSISHTKVICKSLPPPPSITVINDWKQMPYLSDAYHVILAVRNIFPYAFSAPFSLSFTHAEAVAPMLLCTEPFYCISQIFPGSLWGLDCSTACLISCNLIHPCVVSAVSLVASA